MIQNQRLPFKFDRVYTVFSTTASLEKPRVAPRNEEP